VRAVLPAPLLTAAVTQGPLSAAPAPAANTEDGVAGSPTAAGQQTPATSSHGNAAGQGGTSGTAAAAATGGDGGQSGITVTEGLEAAVVEEQPGGAIMLGDDLPQQHHLPGGGSGVTVGSPRGRRGGKRGGGKESILPYSWSCGESPKTGCPAESRLLLSSP
jgi:hypothetical protein